MGKDDLSQDVVSKIETVPQEPQEIWDSIMDGLAEEVLAVSDQDLLAEAAEEGGDPVQEAEAVRRSLLNMVRNASRSRMAVRRSSTPPQ